MCRFARVAAIFSTIAVLFLSASQAKASSLIAQTYLEFGAYPFSLRCFSVGLPAANGLASSCGVNGVLPAPQPYDRPGAPAQGDATASAEFNKITGSLEIVAPTISSLAAAYGSFSTGVEVVGPSGDGFVQYLITGNAMIPNTELRFDLDHRVSISSAQYLYTDGPVYQRTSGPFTYESLLMPVRFGQMFDFELFAVLSFTHAGSASFSVELSEVRVFDANKRPLADAEILFFSPEPGSWILVLSGLAPLTLRLRTLWRRQVRLANQQI